MQDKGYICVWAPDGSPLMPTKRHRHVEKLLNTGKARIACHVPFTIQLLYGTRGIRQPMFAGLDPARSNIGIAVRSDSGTLVFAAVCETRNREIAKLMEDRRKHRRASRNGERKASSGWRNGSGPCSQQGGGCAGFRNLKTASSSPAITLPIQNPGTATANARRTG